jgi:hypothetical protein
VDVRSIFEDLLQISIFDVARKLRVQSQVKFDMLAAGEGFYSEHLQ